MNNAMKSDDDVPTPTKDAGGGAIASKVPGVTHVKQDEGINETHSALRPSTDAFDNDPSTLQTPKISAPIKLLSKMKTGKKLYKNMGMFRNNNRQGVAWKKREAEKIRDDTLDMFPSVDPDDFQIEEPPFPYAEDQHPQVNNQTEEPPSPHREDEGSERPHTGNHMEEPPVTLGNNTVPSTVTFEVPDAQIPSDDLPTAHTINANDIIVPEAVCVEHPVQAEAVETMASNPEFVFLRKQNRLLLIVGVVIIVGLMSLIFTTSDLFSKKKTLNAVPIPSLQQTPAPFLTLSPLILPTLSPLVHPAVLTLPPFEETPTPSSTITSVEPTLVPSMQHQVKPSMRPTMAQSTHPTGKHSMQPSITKSMEPIMAPSQEPIVKPSKQPSIIPSMQPTLKASMEPSKIPSLQPTFMTLSLVRSFAYGDSSWEYDHLLTINNTEIEILTLGNSSWTELCNPHDSPSPLCSGTNHDGPFLLYPNNGSDRVALYRCHTGVNHFFSRYAGCEGATTQSVLGYLSTQKTSETPRPLRRCYNPSGLVHFHWLDENCPQDPAIIQEGILGYVMNGTSPR
uniref:Circumsporozoite protein n=1 Tax=Ditylum brightwellii TaxID=49249 RepID=A0A7S4S927_9STRA